MWIVSAMDYTVEQWRDGIRSYLRDRDKDFPPPMGYLETNYLPSKKKPEKRPPPCHGFIEDPGKSHAENQAAYDEFRGYNTGFKIKEEL